LKDKTSKVKAPCDGRMHNLTLLRAHTCPHRQEASVAFETCWVYELFNLNTFKLGEQGAALRRSGAKAF
jgi:hypothetical protein